ncbi:MAG: hypothetical protein IJF70_00530 [Opitutales bacterium]|nr:hypothetical protein [Opitutales bacterium]
MEFIKRKSAYFWAIAIFALASISSYPLKKIALKNENTISSQSIEVAMNKGFLFGMLGGYRSLISDFVWLKEHLDWEKQNLAGCLSAMELATSIDPYMTTFWTQGASIIAYDTPHWMLAKLPKKARSEKLLNAFKRKQAKLAIEFLDKALAMFPTNSELILQKGQIAVANDDFKLAETCYEKLSNEPNPTVFARRVYAGILTQNGKFQKAIDVLQSILNETPNDSPLRPILTKQISQTKKLLEKI